MMHRRDSCVLGLIFVVIFAQACTERDSFVSRVASPAARGGGTLIVGISQPGSIEPTNAYESSGNLVISTICDPLIQLDPKTGELRPAIARSWQVSDAGQRITVRLRRGVKFHNGKELTAHDVLYSLSRVAREDYGSQVADLVEPIAGFRQVHGEDQEVDDERLTEQLFGIRTIEKYAIEINLSRNLADFIRVLAHPVASPIPENAGEDDPEAFATKPVCAGPYRMDSAWKPGDKVLRVSRFPDYYGQNSAFTRGGKGYAQSIEFRIFNDREAEVADFAGGSLHAAHLPPDRLDQLEPFGEDTVIVPGSILEYVGFPTTLSPYDKPVVRAALSRALDREALTAVYAGSRSPAQSFVPPSLGKIHSEAACAKNAPLSPKLNEARQMLQQAGVDPGTLQIKLRVNNEFSNVPAAEEIARQWREGLGVAASVEPTTWDQHLAAGRSQAGFDSPFRLAWSPEYPSADAFLAPLFSSDDIGVHNFSRFRDARFDRELNRTARRATAETDRQASYRALEDIVCEQMPVIPIAFTTRGRLISKSRVASATGDFADLTTGEPNLRELYLKS